MSGTLLKTKLHVPRPRSGLIGRSRLLERLDEALLLGRSLTLVSAPAGYGKTTLVANWFTHLNQPKAWVSLDEQDNDPIRFFSYLIASLQTIEPDIGQDTARLLSGSGMLPTQAVAVTLINEIMTSSKPKILVLDDFHVITNDNILQAVQSLLDYDQPAFHLVVITREDPAFSLPRLRVRDQMTEIRMSDLRFDLSEAMDFFRNSVGLSLTDEEIAALEVRTEGWIAGLQLAALSARGCRAEQVSEFVKAFSGNHRYIIEYLMDEVIKRIDPHIRIFLTRTAVLNRFNIDLGNELLGIDNSKIIITLLEQSNLFLIPLDNESRWYRYHNLFAQSLCTELTKSELIDTQRRAALWFARNGLPEESIQYALAAGEYDFAIDLLMTQASRLFQRGEIVTLLTWFNQIPPELIDYNLELASYKAWALLFLGKSEDVAALLDRTEQIILSENDSLAHGRLLALKGWIANYREDLRTKEIALLALESLGDRDPFFKEIALLSLGHALRKNAPMSESTATLYSAYNTAHSAGHMFTCLAAMLDITMNLVIQGKRKESMDLCTQTLTLYVDSRGKPLPMAELLYIPLGILQYEGNDLKHARLSLEQGISASHKVGLNRILGGDAEQILAFVYWASGDIDSAWGLLQKAKANTDAKAFQIIWERYQAFEAHLMLKQGDITGARSWVESSGLIPADSITSFKEIPYMVIARTLYRTGMYDQAWELLTKIRQFDLERGRYGRLIYVNIVSALVLKALGRTEEAIQMMTEAVIFAAKEGYVRPFLGEGPEVGDLLSAVKFASPDFQKYLLACFTQQPEHVLLQPEHLAKQLEPFTQTSEQHARTLSSLPHDTYLIKNDSSMIEKLSSRELEVLSLLAAGLSNEAIGTKLYISLGTVKWHVKNIYSKLGVGSRTQAVAKARYLGIISFL